MLIGPTVNVDGHRGRKSALLSAEEPLSAVKHYADVASIHLVLESAFCFTRYRFTQSRFHSGSLSALCLMAMTRVTSPDDEGRCTQSTAMQVPIPRRTVRSNRSKAWIPEETDEPFSASCGCRSLLLQIVGNILDDSAACIEQRTLQKLVSDLYPVWWRIVIDHLLHKVVAKIPQE